MKRLLTFFLISLLFWGMGFGFQMTKIQEKPQLKTVIVSVKFIDITWAGNILQKYRSPFGSIQTHREGNKLIVEDTPEMVEKILSILKELDVKHADLRFTVDLILGSSDESLSEGISRELKADPVIRELQSLMKYKSLRMLDSSLIKVQDNSRSSQRLGGEGMNLRLDMAPRYIKEEKGDSFRVEMRLSQSRWSPEGKEVSTTLIDTTLSLKSGERTVVGVSKLDGGDKALILILSGQIIK